MKPGKGKGPQKISVAMVGLQSLQDLVRFNSTFSTELSHLYAVKERGGGYRIFVRGEKIGSCIVVYSFLSDSIKRYIIYGPHSSRREEVQMVDEISKYLQDYKLYKTELIELLENPFAECKSQKVLVLKVTDYRSLVMKEVHSSEEEKIGKVYLFVHKGKEYIGIFNFFHDDDVTVLLYAEAGGCAGKAFFRYNYISNTLELADSFVENQYPCVRIINLKEPFNFFRPE